MIFLDKYYTIKENYGGLGMKEYICFTIKGGEYEEKKVTIEWLRDMGVEENVFKTLSECSYDLDKAELACYYNNGFVKRYDTNVSKNTFRIKGDGLQKIVNFAKFAYSNCIKLHLYAEHNSKDEEQVNLKIFLSEIKEKNVDDHSSIFKLLENESLVAKPESDELYEYTAKKHFNQEYSSLFTFDEDNEEDNAKFEEFLKLVDKLSSDELESINLQRLTKMIKKRIVTHCKTMLLPDCIYLYNLDGDLVIALNLK